MTYQVRNSAIASHPDVISATTGHPSIVATLAADTSRDR